MNKSVHGEAEREDIREEARLVVNVLRGGGLLDGEGRNLELLIIWCRCWIQSVTGTAVNNDAPGQEDAKLMSISG